MNDYPWYAAIDGDEISQGDFFEGCPVYMPSADATGQHLSQAFARFFMRVGLPVDIKLD